jgi:hypothetical protein
MPSSSQQEGACGQIHPAFYRNNRYYTNFFGKKSYQNLSFQSAGNVMLSSAFKANSL